MSLLCTPTICGPAPSGVVATYYGNVGTTTRNYYVQAIYAFGTSVLNGAPQITTAGLDRNDIVEVNCNAMAGAIGYNWFRVDSSATVPTGGNVYLGSTTYPSFKDDGSITPSAATIVSAGQFTARAHYDFAVDGGAVGEIIPVQSDVIPIGAIVLSSVVNSTTAVTSGGSATVTVGTHAGSSATSILGSTGKASLSGDAVVIGAAQGTPFKMSAAGQINFTVGTAALTAGVIDAIVTYVFPVAL